MNNHQSLKAEIDTREDNFGVCLNLGKELLARNHYASAEIKDRLMQLTNSRNALLHRWEERWENLQLILEVYQFARDAAVAEAWLIAQEPYLMSTELGHTIDEVENLIKKHEAFEKSAAAQEERFSALERLTTFELKEMKRRQEAAEEAERQRLQAEAEAKAAAEAEAEAARQAELAASKDSADAPGSPHSSREHEADRPSPSGEDGLIEGVLTRKHEWESTTKKASNRSWEKVYGVSRTGRLTFYKDQKVYKSKPEETFRNEGSLDLQGATVEIANDYTKKKHVFRIKLANGGEFLLQAHDDSEMQQWVGSLKAQCDSTGGESRSQTLPASSQKDEPKRRSFFTLKKN
jgi:spectrin beta